MSAGRARFTLAPTRSGQQRPALFQTRSSARLATLFSAALLAAGLVTGCLAGEEPPSFTSLELAPTGLEVRDSVPPRISPDGQRLVYAAKGRLWIRDLRADSDREVAESDGAVLPFWSPDSREIGFVRDDALWRTRLDQASPRRIADFGRPEPIGGGASWSPDDLVVFTTGTTPLQQVAADGGTVEILLEASATDYDHFHEPSFLPDGRGIVAVAHRRGGAADTLVALRGDRLRPLARFEGERLAMPAYHPSGRLLFTRIRPTGEEIWLLPFSASRLVPEGEARRVRSDAGLASLSSDGAVLSWVAGRRQLPRQRLVWSDAGGERVGEAAPWVSGIYQALSLSPDGGRLAFVLVDRGGPGQLRIRDFDRGSEIALAGSTEAQGRPVWSADGRSLYFSSVDSRIFRVPADASRPPELVTLGRSPALSADGRWLVVSRSGRGGEEALWSGRLGDGIEESPLVTGPHSYRSPAFSPDGRWIAYESDETGDQQVYVRRFPRGDRSRQVSTAGGRSPVWSGSGNLYFVDSAERLTEVALSLEDDRLASGSPRPLFRVGEPTVGSEASPPTASSRLDSGPFDVHWADGQSRFLSVESAAAAEEPAIVVEAGLDGTMGPE